MPLFHCLGCTKGSVQHRNNCECFVTRHFLRWGVISTSPNPQAGWPTIVGCPRPLIQYVHSYPPYRVGRNKVAGIATRYGLGGPGIESRWRVDFSAPVQTGAGAHPPFYTMVTGSFPGVKRPGRGVDHPPLPSAEGKEYSYTSIPLQVHRGLF